MKRSIARFIMGSSVAAVLVLSTALPAPAQGRHRAVAQMGKVQHQQQAQIRKGMKNGTISKQQGADLVKGERSIQATIAQDKAKGPLTGAEARQIGKETKTENNAIKSAESGGTTTPPTPNQ